MKTFHVEFDLEVEDKDVRQLPEFEVMVWHALDALAQTPYLARINFSVTPTEEVLECGAYDPAGRVKCDEPVVEGQPLCTAHIAEHDAVGCCARN